MEYHHGDYGTYGSSVYNYFGEADYRNAKAQGKSDHEIRDWLNANPDKWAHGPKNRAGGGGWYDELERNIAANPKKEIPLGVGANGIKDPKKITMPGVSSPGVTDPSSLQPNVPAIDANQFAQNYMNKILGRDQDPTRYDPKPEEDKYGVQNPGADNAAATSTANKEEDPYNASRYKNTSFEYKSPQYTG